jgi:hypothetical protein
MLKELLSLSFILTIISLVVAVSFPSLILEPVGWLLNTEIDIHKYGNAGIGNQSASYFDFYIQENEDYYLKFPLIALMICSIILLIPTTIVLLTVLSWHLKTKNKVKESRQRYISSFFEVLSESKFKPSFWLVFCPLIALIYLTKTEHHKTITDIATDNYSIFEEDQFFRPDLLTNYENKAIHWKSVLNETYPIRYIKKGGNFSKTPEYLINVSATDTNGIKLFELNRKARNTIIMEYTGKYLILVDNIDINVIDTHSFKTIPMDLVSRARVKNKNFNIITEFKYNKPKQTINLIDDRANSIDLELKDILNIQKDIPSRVRTSSIPGKDRRAQQLYEIRDSEALKSKQFFKPKILLQNENTVIVSSMNEISDKNNNLITLLDKDLVDKWSYQLTDQNPYIKLFSQSKCNVIDITQTEKYITISYLFININCATEFINKSSGQLEARSIKGIIEYL